MNAYYMRDNCAILEWDYMLLPRGWQLMRQESQTLALALTLTALFPQACALTLTLGNQLISLRLFEEFRLLLACQALFSLIR